MKRDLSRIRPKALLGSYASLISSPHFLTAALVVAGSAGAIYTQATVLPFILIDRVGLSPTQFGVGMLMQTGGYLIGSLLVRQLMTTLRRVPAGAGRPGVRGHRRRPSWRSACACTQPSYLLVMGPVAFYTFGIAFVLPAMTTAALSPFSADRRRGGAMAGFMQMGAGLLGGTIAAFFDDPVEALATIIPAMGVIAILAWIAWRMLPDREPPLPAALRASVEEEAAIEASATL